MITTAPTSQMMLFMSQSPPRWVKNEVLAGWFPATERGALFWVFIGPTE
jgi:hypothetical protein